MGCALAASPSYDSLPMQGRHRAAVHGAEVLHPPLRISDQAVMASLAPVIQSSTCRTIDLAARLRAAVQDRTDGWLVCLLVNAAHEMQSQVSAACLQPIRGQWAVKESG